jgi:hypothetical protein
MFFASVLADVAGVGDERGFATATRTRLDKLDGVQGYIYGERLGCLKRPTGRNWSWRRNTIPRLEIPIRPDLVYLNCRIHSELQSLAARQKRHRSLDPNDLSLSRVSSAHGTNHQDKVQPCLCMILESATI